MHLKEKLNNLVAKMQTIHSTSAAASTAFSENRFELDGSNELALPSPVPDLAKKDPTPTHAKLLQDLQCVASLAAMFGLTIADKVIGSQEIVEIMDNVPSKRKAGLSDLPIPQLWAPEAALQRHSLD
ncbi:hypothetical protein TRAPUB_7134 [Trametes pubescens]|uniref:Uncharacterized protein n=1 Tax=Trametes pubescens TaxID=154538 RepID=A0A1M2V416_TRAPU|nr:hypothetical protein TRAPUB_7134 [Trametes pubescens]